MQMTFVGWRPSGRYANLVLYSATGVKSVREPQSHSKGATIMRFNPRNFGITAAAILSLGTVACHGQDPATSGYVPTSTVALPGSQASQPIEPLGQKGQIDSGCGHRLHIVIAGILSCRFREPGRKDGTFTIANHESGIVEVTPASGTQATAFTIVGLVAGSGYILVKDARGGRYKMRVTVTL
jgi:hypothetical protein